MSRVPAALIGAALLVSPPAMAYRAQGCIMNLNVGQLPIGQPGEPGFDWKDPLMQWIAAQPQAAYTWDTPPQFVDPQPAYNLGSCPATSAWPGLTASDRREIEQYSLLLYGDFAPPYAWFNHKPAWFTLTGMIDPASCDVYTPDMAWGDRLAFWATWDYAGNPFRPGTPNNLVLKRRLAAFVFEQLIMLDRGHYDTPPPYVPAITGVHDHPLAGAGAVNNGAELSAALGELAWTWMRVRDGVPQNLWPFVEEALETYAERVHLWNPFDQHSNRGIRSTHALYYTWEATNSSHVWQWYRDALKQFYHPIGGNWVEGGYWRDDRGFDMGYGGSNLISAVRTMQIDQVGVPSFVTDAVTDAFDLAAHLVLQDVDDRWVTPNVFNSRTRNGATFMLANRPSESYYGGTNRYFGALDLRLPFAEAFLREEDMLAPHMPMAYDPNDPLHTERIACDAQYAGYINAAMNNLPAHPLWPALGTSEDWGTPPSTFELHQPSLLRSWWDDVAADPDLERFPFEFDGPYLRSLGDKFVFAKYGQRGRGQEFAATLHVGEIGFLNSGHEAGWGGGQLVSFWSPQGGPYILGRRLGVNNPPVDDWSQWRTFAWHTVTLRTVNGDLATSARILTPNTQISMLAAAPGAAFTRDALAGAGAWASPSTVPEAQATSALVRVKGTIGVDGRRESDGAPLPAVMTQGVDYERAFLLTGRELFVRTAVGGGWPADTLTEAWETLPLWDRGTITQAGLADARIDIASTSQGSVDGTWGTGGVFDDVTSVQVKRADGVMRILFDEPQRVWIDGVWSGGELISRTLLIDLLPPGCGACALQPHELIYRIESLPIGGDGGPKGDDGPPPKE